MFKKIKLPLFFVCAVSLLSIAFIIFKINSTSNQPIPTPISKTSTATAPTNLEKTEPGKTTRQEVINMLGQPVRDIQENNNETLFYNSTSKTRSDQIIIEGGVVVMIKKMISYGDPEKISDINNVYGLSKYSLYGPDSEGGNKLYVYPDNGIAYIGKPQFDTLEEIWHFVPMSIKDFREKWAPNYSDTPILNLY